MRYNKPWLALPPGLAHDLGPLGVDIYAWLFGQNETPEWQSFSFKNIQFKNRLGIAGGVDKNAESISSYQKCGCGFVEIGTVTPKPQLPNSGKIIDRDLATSSLWNKMGFPSSGQNEVFSNLKSAKPQIQIPVFVNVGKNRITENQNAAIDYISVIDKFKSDCDAFVINISSPNTIGLRDLLKPKNLIQFLEPLAKFKKDSASLPPYLLKLSPDIEKQELVEALTIASDFGFDGFILTNTTSERSPQLRYPLDGGVSGAPLRHLSLKSLEVAVSTCRDFKEKKLIISTGGVMTPGDVFERINNGADLVQVYSALVFEGPRFFTKVADFAKQ